MSAGIGWWIAHVTFWLILVYGWVWDELGVRAIAIFVGLWVLGYALLPHIPHGGAMFFSWVAFLDVALVFSVFKGDVKLS